MSVTVFTKKGCVQCTATIKTFESKGINVDIRDVEKDVQAFDQVQSLGYRNLPVVMAGESHWAGFRPDMISQACV